MSLSKPEQLLEYELSCPICLQLFSDPVALPCGHNYCLGCIRQVSLTKGGDRDPLSCCPECRVGYGGIETLQRNAKLRSIVEGYQAAGPPPMPDGLPETRLAQPEVACDHCVDGDAKAAKTCLQCEVSLCDRHLQKHHEKESFRAHAIVEPKGVLGTRACVTHRRPLEYFCASDMTSLCATCFIEGAHQHHDVLTFDVAEGEMRRALESHNKVVLCRLQMTESLLQKAAVDQDSSEAVGDKLVNRAVTLMDNMASMVDRYRERLSVLLDEERGQRRDSWVTGLSALEEQQQQLLEAQQSAVQALSEPDKFLFIHRYLLIESQIREAITATVHSRLPSKAPLNTNRLQGRLRTQDFHSELTRLLDSLQVMLNPLELTFNLFTAHPSLVLSSDLRTVKYNATKQPYMVHLERFASAPQVLCGQGFSAGEHVWVVEMGDNSMWSLGLCYKSIPRRGDHSRLGHNGVSWRVQWKNKKLTACHASSNVGLPEMFNQPLRIEVTLDYESGTLAFHSIKGRREHLHTFKAVFREPVYPAFSIHSNNTESWITLQSGV